MHPLIVATTPPSDSDTALPATRIRTQLGLRCKQKRKFKATTNSNHALPLAPNLLDWQFTVVAPNRAWVTDTLFPASAIFDYLATKDATGIVMGRAGNEIQWENSSGELSRTVLKSLSNRLPEYRREYKKGA